MALIITIIVLLILATVAIAAVNNTGIIQYAQNSADEYADGRDKENTMVWNYLDIINHYKPDTNTGSVSIIGTYGNTNSITDTWEYYKFEENGLGEFIDEEPGRAGNPVRKSNFTYSFIEDENGIIKMEDNSTQSFSFYAVKDESGKVLNKVVIVDLDGERFFAYPINELIGLQNIDGTVYNGIDEEGIETVSLEDGKCIVKYIDEEESEDYGYYFKLGDYIYIEEANYYFSGFKVIGNEVKNLCD